MPIRTVGGSTPARGGRRDTRLTPRRLAGVVVLAIAVILVAVVLAVAALSS